MAELLKKSDCENPQELREHFVSVAKVNAKGDKIQVGRQEAEYKRRLVYGLKAHWEAHLPYQFGMKGRFCPLDFAKEDRQGVIEYLAEKETARVLEKKAQRQKKSSSALRPHS